jgi:hypothetical protein
MPKISTTPNAELMTQSRDALQGKWALSRGEQADMQQLFSGFQITLV